MPDSVPIPGADNPAWSVSPLAPAERAELRRIVKGRFELLKAQIEQRRLEIAGMVKERLYAENADAIKAAEAECAPLIAEVKVLNARVWDVVDRHRQNGISAARNPYKREEWVKIDGDISSWGPRAVEKQIEAEIEKLATEAGAAKLNLKAAELELLEVLSVDALRSDQARDFLARVPSIDDVLPLPKPVRQVSA